MSNITNTDAVVTEQKLTEFYNDIKPFLGCPAYLTSEGNAEYYSTDEKVIGRWTDGKPLYQKVYSGTTASSGVTSFSITDLSIDKVIDVSGYIEYATNNFLFLSTFTNANDKGIGYASRINAFIDTSYTSKPYAMILKYTKTTDSASTTIQEDPNEYSTDEKIIGKWIDGKPIYQKTFTNLSITTPGTWIAFNHNISNFDDLIQVCSCNVRREGQSDPWIHSVGLTIGFDINKTQFEINSQIPGTAKLTIQYTKTTD